MASYCGISTSISLVLLSVIFVKALRFTLKGQLETRQWVDSNGEKHYTTEVILRNYRGELLLLDSRSREGDTDTRFSFQY